ncbi:MAG TPA: hypothetical protein VNE67_12770 [Acetobacteraceae bacterium]|nr:hypothetical protein [Acetobacteraceae bacterium]
MIGSNLVAAYRRDGFIVVPDVLDADTLAATRAVIAQLTAASAEVTAHDEVYDLEPSHSRAAPRVRLPQRGGGSVAWARL